MTPEAEFELAADLNVLRVYRCGAAAKIELHRPDRINAWNGEFGVALRSTVADLGADPGVRAVLVTGAGRGFSSGADLRDRPAPGEPGHYDTYTRLTELYHPIITGIRRMPKPVVAAVHGPAAGIGCSLALCCDLIIAAESAYFLQAFVNIGLIPDGGSTALVPARIGLARAAELAMLGERLPAATALDWGLVNRVVPDEELLPQAHALTLRLAAGPTRSYAGAKQALNAWVYGRLDEQLELEARLQQEMSGSADFAEGVAAFGAKRPPRFTGS
jgi:2-(1,2-epoxy-1,2-dihydrophenyl)acetyl-CoA isomerase